MIEINWIGESLDTVFSLLGKYGRWLNARGKRACFLLWNICCVYWIARDFYIGLYAQAFFCIFSVGLNVYGFINWKNKFGDKS